MVGPAILQFGTEDQKRRFLPKILAGEEVWCQGYSSPTRAPISRRSRPARGCRQPLVVNGQKTWTTYAQFANGSSASCGPIRGAKKQSGHSPSCSIDLKTPGVTVKRS